MTPTLRKPNACLDCDYEWYPRGKGRSLKCPGCGSKRTYVMESVESESDSNWGTYLFLGLVATGGFIIFWQSILVVLSFGAVGYGVYTLHNYLRLRCHRRAVAKYHESLMGHKTYDIPGGVK